ncbi:hypothetical protein AMELA_G00088050 [Ameiurus melas]|uniref:Uncharacterized protein n=1 Tax=Ameiurus melas TaxID=219545 RepID=A0A7J6AXC4_AMEME|nr:hypothetical protein AMELA_G00088050 [Ameiurus melas]
MDPYALDSSLLHWILIQWLSAQAKLVIKGAPAWFDLNDGPLWTALATETWLSGLLEGETSMQEVLHRYLLEIHIPTDHQSHHCSSRTTHRPQSSS